MSEIGFKTMFVEDVTSLLELERKGVKVVTKKNLRVMRRKVAGHYSPWTSVISVNKDVSYFWVSTFATLLHEFRHHQQRTMIFVSMTICFGGSIGIWLYGRLVNSYPFIYGSLGMMMPAVLLYHYFEFDARRYERNSLPDVMMYLLPLEYSLIAQSLSLNKTARKNLQSFHKEIQDRAPHLFAD